MIRVTVSALRFWCLAVCRTVFERGTWVYPRVGLFEGITEGGGRLPLLRGVAVASMTTRKGTLTGIGSLMMFIPCMIPNSIISLRIGHGGGRCTRTITIGFRRCSPIHTMPFYRRCNVYNNYG